MKKRGLLEVLQHRYPEKEKKTMYAYILCGNVYVNGEKVTQPTAGVPLSSKIELRFKKYVSRGGQKLEAALAAFQCDVSGKVVLDAGASTGGFTDCLLRHGAGTVHAVDVGTNQLDYSLRRNEKVIVREKTRIQSISSLDPPPHGAVADLSFRSITGIAGHILELTTENWLAALVKPQFEIDQPEGAFCGVITNKDTHKRLLQTVITTLAGENVHMENIITSPIKGTKGNTEFFMLLHRKEPPIRIKESLEKAERLFV